MIDRLREERGEVSLTQLLMAMVIFGGVLAATLGTFESFVTLNAKTQSRVEAQDRARTQLDALAKQLRNLASPTQDQPQAVDKASPYDIVFQTVDPNGPNGGLNASNVRRVRYCLESADTSNAKLYMQSQTWTTQTAPAVPSTATCPSASWGNNQLVADHVTNRSYGRERPVFAFNTAELASVSSLHADLFIDLDPLAAPEETRLSTGVFLRNQNRRPTAAFTATPTAQGIILNGSASVDPEGEQLSYVWYDGATKVGTGITTTYVVARGTVRTLTLKVYDPAALEGVAPSQAVTA